MTTLHETPPPLLPDGYHELWRLLADADRRAPSRQALARDLGVATQTLQRLLVSGDVPRFHERRNRREIRAWCRTLARLAHRFGREPREWIEMVGIPWDETAATAVERTLGSIHSAVAEAGRVDPLDRIRAQSPPTVRIGILAYNHFAEPLPSFGRSFFHTLAERLVGSIDPTWQVDVQTMPLAALVDALTAEQSPLDFVVAMFDTVERRSRGFDFVPIHGWRIRHSALWIRHRDDPRPRPRWRDISVPGRARVRFHVIDQQAGHVFLLGQCGFEPGAIVPDGQMNLAKHFWDLAREEPDKYAIHVDEETTCDLITRDLSSRPDFAAEWRVEEIEGAPHECPRYDLAIAIPPGASEWHRLLVAAQETELYGNSARQTARLYAETMLAGVMSHTTGRLEPTPPRSPWCPIHFELASAEFQRELCVHLHRGVIRWLGTRATRLEPDLTPDARNRLVRALARNQVLMLIPDEWRRPLTEVLDAEDPAPPTTDDGSSSVTGELARTRASLRELDEQLSDLASRLSDQDATGPDGAGATWCHSCASLLGHATSDTATCRVCTDDAGQLRPRTDIEAAIARQLAATTTGLDPQEARRRAQVLMSALPAWADEGVGS